MFRVNRTPEEVVEILDLLIQRNLSDADCDDFISIKIKDSFLEAVRCEVEGLWVENSPYLEPGAIDPNRLRIKELKGSVTFKRNYYFHLSPTPLS